MQKYNILELNEKLLPELQSIAEELGIKKASSLILFSMVSGLNSTVSKTVSSGIK